MPAYKYEVSGSASDGQTWAVDGEVDTTSEGEFPRMVQESLRSAFEKLTQGKAVHGKPGVGCRGPYRITKLVVERVP